MSHVSNLLQNENLLVNLEVFEKLLVQLFVGIDWWPNDFQIAPN